LNAENGSNCILAKKKREEFHRLAQPSGEGLQLMKIETQGHTNSEENS